MVRRHGAAQFAHPRRQQAASFAAHATVLEPTCAGPVAWALILIGAAAALLVGGVFMGAIGFFVARRNANARIAERGQLPVKAYVVVATDTTALKTASRSSSYSNV